MKIKRMLSTFLCFSALMMSCTSIPAYAQTNESADPGTTEERQQEETQPEDEEDGTEESIEEDKR